MAQRVNGADYGTQIGRLSDRIGSPRGANIMTFPQDPQRSVYLFEDFLEDTINLDKWVLEKDSSATDYVITSGGAQGGTIAGTTGTGAGEGIGIKGFPIWSGDKNCGMEVRMKLSYVTKGILEIGFADALTSVKDPAISDIDTVANGNGVADFAVIHRDTAQTLTTAALATLGSTPYTVAKSALGTWAPTANVYFTARVQLIGDNVFAAIFDADGGLVVSTSIAKVAAGAGGIEGGVAVFPYVNVTYVATTAIIPTIDYLRCWQDRA